MAELRMGGNKWRLSTVPIRPALVNRVCCPGAVQKGKTRFAVGPFLNALLQSMCQTQRLGGMPGIQVLHNSQVTRKASLSLRMSKRQPMGSAPKQAKTNSTLDAGRMMDCFTCPLWSVMLMVVPSTLVLRILNHMA